MVTLDHSTKLYEENLLKIPIKVCVLYTKNSTYKLPSNASRLCSTFFCPKLFHASKLPPMQMPGEDALVYQTFRLRFAANAYERGKMSRRESKVKSPSASSAGSHRSKHRIPSRSGRGTPGTHHPLPDRSSHRIYAGRALAWSSTGCCRKADRRGWAGSKVTAAGIWSAIGCCSCSRWGSTWVLWGNISGPASGVARGSGPGLASG